MRIRLQKRQLDKLITRHGKDKDKLYCPSESGRLVRVGAVKFEIYFTSWVFEFASHRNPRALRYIPLLPW